MFYELKRQIEYFLKNKIYMASLIIAAIAGYGYEITHSSLGIDDVYIGIYSSTDFHVCSNCVVSSVKVCSRR